MRRRLFDVIVAVAGLAICSVPCALAAAAIKLTTDGPVLFPQERVGQHGRVFWFYKFRTMRVDSSGSHVTVGGDSRVHTLGRWLRRWKPGALSSPGELAGSASRFPNEGGGRCRHCPVRRWRVLYPRDRGGG